MATKTRVGLGQQPNSGLLCGLQGQVLRTPAAAVPGRLAGSRSAVRGTRTPISSLKGCWHCSLICCTTVGPSIIYFCWYGFMDFKDLWIHGFMLYFLILYTCLVFLSSLLFLLLGTPSVDINLPLTYFHYCVHKLDYSLNFGGGGELPHFLAVYDGPDST